MVHPMLAGNLSALAKSAAVLVGGAYFYVSTRKKRRERLGDASGDSGIDYAILEAAERAVARNIDDERRELGRQYRLWLRTPTSQMSETKVLDWQEEMAEKGIDAKVLFEPALSARGGRHLTKSGFHELYVHERDLSRMMEHAQ